MVVVVDSVTVVVALVVVVLVAAAVLAREVFNNFGFWGPGMFPFFLGVRV